MKKTPIQQLKSNKLFFKKWAYKIECVVHEGWRIRLINREQLSKVTADEIYYVSSMWARSNSPNYLDNLIEFIGVAGPIIKDKSLSQMRVEGSNINLFCNDPEVFNQLKEDLKKWIIALHEPADQFEKDFLINNGHTKILCNKYPNDHYSYKVVLNERMTPSNRATFLTWAEKYGNKILISGNSKNWLQGHLHWKQDPFFYVDSGPTLTMVTLFLGAYARKIYEYIPRETLVKQ